MGPLLVLTILLSPLGLLVFLTARTALTRRPVGECFRGDEVGAGAGAGGAVRVEADG